MPRGVTKDLTRKAFAVANSDNSKLGKASTTYAGPNSCPDRCSLKGNGCYAEMGRVGMIKIDLEKAGGTPREIALEEAKAIREMNSRLPLRLHTYGDCPDEESAQIVGEAASEYMEITGAPAWTYTHAWPDVPRIAWRDVSVMASCETMDEVYQAREMGYAPVLVVEKHDGKKSIVLDDGLRLVPCPNQTSGGRIKCVDCGLCLHDRDRYEQGQIITFEAHGMGAKRVRKQLKLKEVQA
jgi:hypothetical protein